MKEVYYICKTAYGIFNLKITIYIDRNTEIPSSFTISLGTKEKQCVQITVPSRESKKSDAYLMWVEADELCSLERYIEKGLAQHMTLLGLTIAKNINPSLKTIYFKDTSSFKCDLPDETKETVPMKTFHIAFHGATWYEYYFGAKLKTDFKKYIELKQNLYNPSSKPDTYNFINHQLQEELDPLFASAKTWYEFFQLISKKYNKKKCTVIYPWLFYAMTDIFKCNIFQETEWYIEFNDNPKLQMIEYKLYNDTKTTKGGRRKTIKKRKARQFTHNRLFLFPHITTIQKWDYLKFLYG
jgi:hypothetical protein